MKNIIEHCRHRIPTDKVYTFNDYPYSGDVTVAYYAMCMPKPEDKRTHHSAYAFFVKPLNAECTELEQADKITREKLDSMVRQGKFIETFEGKPTRACPYVGDYTRDICKPADANIKKFSQQGTPSNYLLDPRSNQLHPVPVAIAARCLTSAY